MKKVKYLGYNKNSANGYDHILIPNKVYDIIKVNYEHNSIFLKDENGFIRWFSVTGYTGDDTILFEDVTIEYNRNELITEILS